MTPFLVALILCTGDGPARTCRLVQVPPGAVIRADGADATGKTTRWCLVHGALKIECWTNKGESA